jgi:hypothetical protein
MQMTEKPLRTLDDIKARNAAAGYYFFDRDTMSAFKSRCSETVYPLDDGECLFVTSERNSGYTSYGAYDFGRLYTVRLARTDGSIDTMGDFQEYKSRNGAHNAARLLAYKLNKGDA